MANLLGNEQSLYLRQHSSNPVQWQPWGTDALAEAAERDVPLLVSIGYSACHWCHVMAHECFEDDYIAGLMNRHFVCVKVDREEHPDIDSTYMQSVQMITGRGGWPLNVFCLPDGRPFFGGTYFPPDDRGHGIIPWPQLLMRIADHWQRDRKSLVENADNIIKNLAGGQALDDGKKELGAEDLSTAVDGLLGSLDTQWGGFGGAPKFPPSMVLNFLLTQSHDNEAKAVADKAIRLSLDKMARGGIYDQIGGGFARYSVDATWTIPHFEKMLYDNALLLGTYARAFAAYSSPLYQSVCEETVDWLLREMKDPKGAFYAALDADSEGEEGKYYVWTPDAIKEVLGDADGERFCKAYGITEAGNFENGTSNPQLGDTCYDERQALAPMRQKLLAVRGQRIAPGCDQKQILSWNGLLLDGLATAAFIFDKKDWFTLAAQTADFLWDNLRTDDGLFHSVYYKEGGARFEGKLDDYAFFAKALFNLASAAEVFEPAKAATFRDRALSAVDTIWQNFRDPNAPGCFFTVEAQEQTLPRRKEWFDNAVPSGNSAWLHILTIAYAVTGKADYAKEISRLRSAYGEVAQKYAHGLGMALEGWAQRTAVLTIGKNLDRKEIRNALVNNYDHGVQLTSGNSEQSQLCIGNSCHVINSVDELREAFA